MITRFSIRSLLISTVCVSLCLGLPDLLPTFLDYSLYVSAFGISAISLGYDFEPNRRGMLVGFSWGLLIGSILANIMVFAVPASK